MPFGGLLNWLVENERWPRNPLAKVGKVDNRAKESENKRALTYDETVRILGLDCPRALIYHSYYTGLRRGKLKGLQWRDLFIDAEPYRLRVRAEDAKSRRIGDHVSGLIDRKRFLAKAIPDAAARDAP